MATNLDFHLLDMLERLNLCQDSEKYHNCFSLLDKVIQYFITYAFLLVLYMHGVNLFYMRQNGLTR